MTVKAIYEGGVFKLKEKVNLEDKTEVELEIKPVTPKYEDENDARSFVGFIKKSRQGRSRGAGPRQAPAGQAPA